MDIGEILPHQNPSSIIVRLLTMSDNYTSGESGRIRPRDEQSFTETADTAVSPFASDSPDVDRYKRVRRRPQLSDDMGYGANADDHDRMMDDNDGDNHASDIHNTPADDCYDHVMKGRMVLGNGKIRSSWFTHDDWLWRSEDSAVPSGSMAISSGTDSSDVSMTIQMKALHSQLCQLKRRFGTAVEQCAVVTRTNQPWREFERARRLCNPFELLGEGKAGGMNQMFMNRAAIKLANINAVVGFSLIPYGSPGVFKFADLCGAPGGFSEYIVQQCRDGGVRTCRGFGMSLVGTNEHGNGTPWKLSNYQQQYPDGSTTTYQLSGGADGTGDIYNFANVEHLGHEIQAATGSHKVHLVVADGGFDAQRDFEYQEHIAQKVVVCQAVAAMALLEDGGSMVMKVFGFQTSTIRALMRNLFMAFERLVVVKPISSRPASAERYLVCRGFRGIPFGRSPVSLRNAVFLDDFRVVWSEQENQAFERLERYLDRVDYKMMNLNLKACFAILSTLERRYRALPQGTHDRAEQQQEQQRRNWFNNRHNVEAYKAAWRLPR